MSSCHVLVHWWHLLHIECEETKFGSSNAVTEHLAIMMVCYIYN